MKETGRYAANRGRERGPKINCASRDFSKKHLGDENQRNQKKTQNGLYTGRRGERGGGGGGGSIAGHN